MNSTSGLPVLRRKLWLSQPPLPIDEFGTDRLGRPPCVYHLATNGSEGTVIRVRATPIGALEMFQPSG